MFFVGGARTTPSKYLFNNKCDIQLKHKQNKIELNSIINIHKKIE